MAQSFEIPVEAFNEDEHDFDLRLRNLNGEVQRQYITGHDRDEPVVVSGRLSEVVHGYLKQDFGSPCTLAVFDFDMQSRQLRKRFKEVQITILFASKGHEGDSFYDPIVVAMAPEGCFYLLHTQQKVDEKVAAEASVQGQAPVGGSAASKLMYELVKSTERSDYIRVNGYRRVDNSKGQERNKPNAVEWNLFENVSQQSGVPTHIRTAVLLERQPMDDTKFTATVKVKSDENFFRNCVRKIKDIAHLLPRDDPVIFDPTKPPTTTRFGITNLSAVNLHDACTFSSHVGCEAPTGRILTEETPKA